MSSSAESDNTNTASSLLVRVRARDQQAWQRLTELYGPLVYHWCRHLGLGEHDAADVFQEVFAAVARSIDRYLHHANGSFRGWLWTITRNKVRDYFRREQHRAAAAGGTVAQQQLGEIPDQLSEPENSSDEQTETAAVFFRALDLVRGEFEDRTWTAFWRVAVEGCTTAEVADELGITANGVRQAKSRVLRRLRQELGDVP